VVGRILGGQYQLNLKIFQSPRRKELIAYSLVVASASNPLLAAYGDFNATFLDRYRTEFGFVLQNRRIIVDDIRIRGLGKNETPPESKIQGASEVTPPAESNTRCRLYFDEGGFDAPIYLTKNLLAGHKITGPAVLIDQLSTIVVEPECGVQVTPFGDLIMDVKTGGKHGINADLDPVHLSIFSHRFMSIAEQMGRVLQRTSISTNIKERLDFSCALFGPDGGLVSNAPHIPFIWVPCRRPSSIS